MTDFIAVLQVLLELCLALGRESGRWLMEPLLTAICLTCAYTVIHVTREGGLAAGLRAAFLENDAAKAERRRVEEQMNMQSELRRFAAAHRLIDQLLETMLARANGASRVRLNVIHNGISGLTGVDLLRYDVTNGVAAPGRSVGESVVNQPLSDWADFLPQLLSGTCSMHHVCELKAAAIRARFSKFGATSLLVCPASDVQGKTVGAIFVFWDGADQVPDGDALRKLMGAGQHLGAQVAAVLDLQGPPPWPTMEQAEG